MLRTTYAPHKKAFTARVATLRKSFAKYNRAIASRAFAKLPWESHPALTQIAGKGHFTHLVLVGMGGSSLGMKALSTALGIKGITFLDNVDPDFVQVQIESLNIKKTLFLLVSKSGSTIEVLSLAEILFAKIKSARNFLTITDSMDSALALFSKKKKIPCITSPANVPGRFSILSIAGLLPAALAGINPVAVLTGAQQTEWEDAFTLAAHQFLHFKSGSNITVFFPYSEDLTYVAEWYIQLLSESIGKSAQIGITPVKALGVKDQHSQLQLFLDGPRDKFFIFLKPDTTTYDFTIPDAPYTLGQLFDAEYQGVIGAFKERNIPFCEIAIPALAPEFLGELFFFLELEIAFLGKLFNVNAENQPAVEFSKAITKRVLKKY